MTATISVWIARGMGVNCCHQLWQSGCSIAFSNDLNFGSRQLFLERLQAEHPAWQLQLFDTLSDLSASQPVAMMARAGNLPNRNRSYRCPWISALSNYSPLP